MGTWLLGNYTKAVDRNMGDTNIALHIDFAPSNTEMAHTHQHTPLLPRNDKTGNEKTAKMAQTTHVK